MIILIDGDDTIWLEEQKFKEYKKLLLGLVEKNVNAKLVDDYLEKQIALLGFGRTVFVQAILQTAKQFDLVDAFNEKAMPGIMDLLNFNMIMLEGFHEFSTKAKEYNHELFLYTKGREEEQIRKAWSLALESLFSRIFVVPVKNSDVLREILAMIGIFSPLQNRIIPAERVVMIGNCPKDDIGPAVELGLEAIYFNFPGNPRSKNILPDVGFIEVADWYQVQEQLFYCR
jgi:FMN phosphatase YigB (HAD superfamily)